jgi:hypothetical protein
MTMLAKVAIRIMGFITDPVLIVVNELAFTIYTRGGRFGAWRVSATARDCTRNMEDARAGGRQPDKNCTACKGLPASPRARETALRGYSSKPHCCTGVCNTRHEYQGCI